MSSQAVSPGLCGTCAHARTVVSGKGSTFYMCRLAAVDPTFRKYPPLPVLSCRGHQEKGAGGDDPRPPRG
jgi:hypothetical protein